MPDNINKELNLFVQTIQRILGKRLKKVIL